MSLGGQRQCELEPAFLSRRVGWEGFGVYERGGWSDKCVRCSVCSGSLYLVVLLSSIYKLFGFVWVGSRNVGRDDLYKIMSIKSMRIIHDYTFWVR